MPRGGKHTEPTLVVLAIEVLGAICLVLAVFLDCELVFTMAFECEIHGSHKSIHYG